MDAAARLDVALTVASEEPSTLEDLNPGGLLTLDFQNPLQASKDAAAFACQFPIDAVVGVDDATTGLQAAIAAALGLSGNSYAAVAAARNKHRMRQALREGGMAGPQFWLFPLDGDIAEAGRQVVYPCVLKPLVLSASRGVIRANNPEEFFAAFARIGALLRQPEIASLGSEARQILVEEYVPGPEVALEGLLLEGELRVLALFDKPDPLEGPYFEETLYITPSCLAGEVQNRVREIVARACGILDLREGPIHAELRIGQRDPTIIEVNPRSIGGRCSRAIRFDAGLSLEEIILRRALRLPLPSLEPAPGASGVMMIPIPGVGTLLEVRGQEEAVKVPGIVELSLNVHPGQQLVPLPEGSVYMGFLFARADTRNEVERALREAHRRLEFRMDARRRV